MQAASTRIRTYVLADLLLVSTAIGGLWMSGSFRSEAPNAVGKVLVAVLMVMLIAVVMGMYRRNAVTEPRFRARCLAAVLGCSFILGAGTSLFSGGDPTRLPLVIALTFCLAVMVGLRAVLHRMPFSEPQTRKILAVLPDSSVATLRKLSINRRSAIEAMAADQDASGELIPSAREALLLALNAPGITDVVLGDNITLDSGLAMELAEQQRNGLRVTSLSRFMAEEFDRMPHNDPETLRRLILHSLPRSRASLLPKRMLDIVLSLILLILLLPVMIVVAVLVKLEDGGPLLYRQTRVGLNQKHFTLLKFRSMRVDAEANGVARWADNRDTRITRIGNFIRRTRFDELPQFLNILRGDMSLVGPRPERPEMIEQLKSHIPAYDFRHLVPPGLTGWAQINYPYGASIEDAIEKTNYDLYYVTHRSYMRDFLIMLETIRVVLFAEGAR